MPDRPQVTLLSPDLSGNLMIRAYELIELLRRDFRIQIVGRGRAGKVWEPLAKVLDVECRALDLRSRELARRARSISREFITGDLIVALGLRPGSYGLGLIARSTLGRPLVLDNHEWETAYSPPLFGDRPSLSRSALAYRAARWWVDRKHRSADAMFVTNTFLQRRYGGYWLPHVRDEQTFQPRTVDSREERSQDGRGEALTVMFLGTARPYKGLSDLLRAWTAVETPGIRLRIIAVLEPEERDALARQADDRVSFEPPVALDQVPSTLAEADIVVIPQQHERRTIGQLPSKLVEAMAMGRAIVATAVGDAPLWLAQGAGVIVPPSEPAELARAITSLAASRDRRVELGLRARERFLRLGSVAAHRERVVDLFHRLLERRDLPQGWPSIAALAAEVPA